LVSALLLAIVPIHSQQKKPRSSPAADCIKGNPWRNDDSFSKFYFKSVEDNFEPADWKKGLIRITVRGEANLMLWTDGEQFRLWTYTTDPHNIYKYFDELSDACRLPASPALAAAFIKIKWERADISAAQFAQFHVNLTQALAQYASSAQQRYDSMMQTKLWAIYLDAVGYRVFYENSYEHMNAEVMEDPKQYKRILDWIHSLQDLAETRFHRHFGIKDRE
jgi:hypothetical protein